MRKLVEEYKRAFLLGYAPRQSQVAEGLDDIDRMIKEGLNVLPDDPLFLALDRRQKTLQDHWNAIRAESAYMAEVRKSQEWLTQTAKAIHAESN